MLKTIKSRVIFLGILPWVLFIIFFLISWGIYTYNAELRSQANHEYRSTQLSLNLSWNERIDRINLALRNEEMTREEWNEQASIINHQHSENQIEASEKWVQSGLPDWAMIFAQLSYVGSILLIPLTIIFYCVWYAMSLQLLKLLRQRGYEWLTIIDALWLAFIFPRTSGRAPKADDFLTLPDTNQTTESLIQFLRMKKKYRAKK